MSAKILFVSDFYSVHENADKLPLAGDRKVLLENAIKRAGISISCCDFYCIHPHFIPSENIKRLSDDQIANDKTLLKAKIQACDYNAIVPLGEYCLQTLTGLNGIDKWHCSVVKSTAEYGFKKCIPLQHPRTVQKIYSLNAFLTIGCFKLRKEMETGLICIPEQKFHHSVSYEALCDLILTNVKKDIPLAIDIETGLGQINTVGIAWDKQESVAIRVDQKHLKDSDLHYKTWKLIKDVLENDNPKILQNAMYECQFLSKYGIEIKNIVHDTMWCMKFLHPEFEKGLDNVARVYTPYPYWKDDNDDWSNVQDWARHLTYNCKDTQGTLWAYFEQKKALEERKLDKVFYGFVMKFLPCIREMCTSGIGVSANMLNTLRENAEREIHAHTDLFDRICKDRINKTINIRSPKQLKDGIKAMGYALPTKKGSETTDKKALVKLARKHPKEEIFPALIKISEQKKRLDSYLNFAYDNDNRVRYHLDGCATETGRWAGYNDAWGKGFNPQTVPEFLKKALIATKGKYLVNIDLEQAESRYVAYDAPEPTLIKMLENRDDIHKYVASRIFKKPAELINKQERQLGKKSGHGANYGIGPDTFAEQCLVDMGIVLTRFEAKRILDSYLNEVFPGIRRRQLNIQEQVKRTKKLTTPLGRERIFYDRIGDSLFREAYAYAPQSTIPDITNYLMLFLQGNCNLLLQVHDSLLIEVDSLRHAEVIADMARSYSEWHPEINLNAGKLVIPVSVKVGESWYEPNMETI